MDPRVKDHARIIVDHSIDLQAGDEVIISAPSEAEDLVVALHEYIGKRGGYPLHLGSKGDTRMQRAFLREMDPDDYEEVPDTEMSLAEAADALIGIGASSNTHEGDDVPPETRSAAAELLAPANEVIRSKRWVATQHPASGNAQDAEMSSEAYADFVYDAINKDWDAQRDFQSGMAEILDAGSDVRIVSGESTDITMSIDGMNAANDNAELNLPGGEVFTAPVPESVEGEVLFDKPVNVGGRQITNVRLVFDDGEVVEHEADKNTETLSSLLDTDDGSRRLGELGIGMNRDITQFTHNMLFDEKMGDTIHLALGLSYPENVGPERDGNDSAIHKDLIVDMSEDSYIEIDGEIVQRNGTFAFEEGFKG